MSFSSVGGLAIDLTFPQSVAIDRGYFKKNNIDFKPVTVSGVDASCSSIEAGSTDIGECTPNLQIPAVQKGADLTQFDTELAVPNPYWLVVKKGTTWSDLKGKVVTLSGPTDSPMYYFQQMAKQGGLSASDFKFTYIGSSGARYAALQAGKVQGALLALPVALLAEQAGYESLATTLGMPGFSAAEFSGGGMVAKASWAKSHTAELLAYMRAIQEAITWINDPANESAVTAEFKSAYKLPSDAVAQAMYKALVGNSVYNSSLCSTPAAETGAIAPLTALGALPAGNYPPSKYAPNTYVEMLTGKSC